MGACVSSLPAAPDAPAAPGGGVDAIPDAPAAPACSPHAPPPAPAAPGLDLCGPAPASDCGEAHASAPIVLLPVRRSALEAAARARGAALPPGGVLDSAELHSMPLGAAPRAGGAAARHSSGDVHLEFLTQARARVCARTRRGAGRGGAGARMAGRTGLRWVNCGTSVGDRVNAGAPWASRPPPPRPPPLTPPPTTPPPTLPPPTPHIQHPPPHTGPGAAAADGGGQHQPAAGAGRVRGAAGGAARRRPRGVRRAALPLFPRCPPAPPTRRARAGGRRPAGGPGRRRAESAGGPARSGAGQRCGTRQQPASDLPSLPIRTRRPPPARPPPSIYLFSDDEAKGGAPRPRAVLMAAHGAGAPLLRRCVVSCNGAAVPLAVRAAGAIAEYGAGKGQVRGGGAHGRRVGGASRTPCRPRARPAHSRTRGRSPATPRAPRPPLAPPPCPAPPAAAAGPAAAA